MIENKPMAWGALAALLVFLAGLLVWDAGCQTGVPLAPKAADPLAELAAYTVMIEKRCDGAVTGYGSGLAIDDKHVLTVGHMQMCKSGKPTARVAFVDGNTYMMHVGNAMLDDLGHGIGTDGWIKLEIDSGSFSEPIAKPIYAFPKQGETVCTFTGIPKRTKVCGVVDEADGSLVFGYTTPVVPGNSGSPVYDSNGKLVGLTLYCLTENGTCRPVGGGAVVSFVGMLL